jgi:hypothetical protein
LGTLKYAAAALCTVALTAAPLTGTAKASKPIFLRCVTSDGKPLYGKVVFDLDKSEMNWSAHNYSITGKQIDISRPCIWTRLVAIFLY